MVCGASSASATRTGAFSRNPSSNSSSSSRGEGAASEAARIARGLSQSVVGRSDASDRGACSSAKSASSTWPRTKAAIPSVAATRKSSILALLELFARPPGTPSL